MEDAALTEGVASNEKPKSTTGLLDLPAEIWSHICTLAVTEPDWIHACDGATPSSVACAVHPPNITRVCKAIRAEALPAFYARNVFYVTIMLSSVTLKDIRGLGYWIDMLLDTGWWKHVKECRVRTPRHYREQACEKLEKWVRLWNGKRAGLVVSLCEQTERWARMGDGGGVAWPSYEISIGEVAE